MIPNIYFAQECKFVSNKKIGETQLDNVFYYPIKKMEQTAELFRKSKLDESFQMLYYRNTGVETLTYLELGLDNAIIENSSGFKIDLDKHNLNKIELSNLLNELRFDNKVYEQSCTEGYFPVGNQIIEQVWLKKNGKLSLVYFGAKDPIIGMKEGNNIKGLQKILSIIYYKWHKEWNNK